MFDDWDEQAQMDLGDLKLMIFDPNPIYGGKLMTHFWANMFIIPWKPKNPLGN